MRLYFYTLIEVVFAESGVFEMVRCSVLRRGAYMCTYQMVKREESLE